MHTGILFSTAVPVIENITEIARGKCFFKRKIAHEDGTAQHAWQKSRTFLVCPCGNGQRTAMREFLPGERPQRFKRTEHADAAVKHAGVRHGVDMRTGNDGIAVFRSGQNAEDIAEQGWKDLLPFSPTPNDSVIGIAASGTTPYVVGAIRQARSFGLTTGCITSNPQTPLAAAAEFPVETIVGPEFVTGSSRMKSGTAQKMVLNMISTTLMIRLGRVQGNRMVNMQLTNAKLIDRGTKMIQESLGLSYDEARKRLLEAGSVSGVL